MTARLTNAVDEALVRRGLLAADQVRSCDADALVDTGAVRVVVPSHIAVRLGLGLRGQRVAEYADGRREAVSVTEPLIVELEGRDTLEEALVLGDEVLIGHTVLEKLDLFVDGQGRRLVPNPAHPDQPVTKVKEIRWGRARGSPGGEPCGDRRGNDGQRAHGEGQLIVAGHVEEIATEMTALAEAPG